MKTLNIKFVIVLLLTGVSSIYSQNDRITNAFTQSYESETKKDYVSATKSLMDVYDAQSYEINLRLGWLNYEAALYKESLTYYQNAITLMPYSIEAKFGYVYPAAAQGNMDQVIEQYKKILEIDPQNTVASYRMGIIYYDKKDYPTSYKYLEKVVNLYPFGYDALLMYAWTNYQMGKTREAKVLFNKVLLLSPKDKSALEGLGLIK